MERCQPAEIAAAGLRPLATADGAGTRGTASQPLLLIMLALYDADGNPLQRATAALNEAELYERLLVRFAEREIRKSGADMPDEAVPGRGRAGTAAPVGGGVRDVFTAAANGSADVELNADLPALLGAPGSKLTAPGCGRHLAPRKSWSAGSSSFMKPRPPETTPGCTLMSSCTRRSANTSSRAWLPASSSDLADAAQFAADRNRPEPAADAFLYALLSYMPLTMRGTIVSFAAEQMRALPEARRLQLGAVLLELFGDAFGQRHDTRYEDYIPQLITRSCAIRCLLGKPGRPCRSRDRKSNWWLSVPRRPRPGYGVA